jgi:hypothetical protein
MEEAPWLLVEQRLDVTEVARIGWATRTRASSAVFRKTFG